MNAPRPYPKRAVIALALAVCFGLGGYESSLAQQSAADTTLTDAQIMQVFIVSNRGEIVTSEPVIGTATNPDVQQFAQLMIDVHSRVIEQADSLANALAGGGDLQPEPNPVSSSLTKVAKGVAQSLQGKQGAELDEAYAKAQVILHGHTLDMLDHVLIPGAQNAELKALLEETRPKVADHLERAQELHHAMMTP